MITESRATERAVSRVELGFSQAWHRLQCLGVGRRVPRVALAVSGGLDSMVLAHLCARAGLAQHIFHVDHGLQAMSTQWERFVRHAAQTYGLDFASLRLSIPSEKLRAQGVEASAREGRYKALASMFTNADLAPSDVLALAHHQADQAETFLLQALRGAGPKGLSAMAEYQPQPGMTLWRPLLTVSKADLQLYAEAFGMEHVNDPSNASSKYRRNALRHEVMPILEKHFPGYEQSLVRSALFSQQAQTHLELIANDDLLRVLKNPYSIQLEVLLEFEPERLANLVRYWIGKHLQTRAMSAARLEALITKLKSAARNPPPRGEVLLTHEAWQFVVQRGVLRAVKTSSLIGELLSSSVLSADLRTALERRAAELSGRIEWRAAKGKDRFQERENGPHRSLKNVFQAANLAVNMRRGELAVFIPQTPGLAPEVAYIPTLERFGARFRPAFGAT